MPPVRRLSRLSVACTALLLCSLATAAHGMFRDDFDTLDTSRWTVYQNEGSARIEDGTLVLSAGAVSRFPFMHSSSNPFPLSGDFSLKLRVRFRVVAEKGTGIQAGVGVPRNGLENPSWAGPGNQFWYWGDSMNCPRNYACHDVEFLFQSGQLSEFDNGVLVSQKTCKRPDVLWMGNPSSTWYFGTWSSFELDYVEVSPVPEPSGLIALTIGLCGLARRRR